MSPGSLDLSTSKRKMSRNGLSPFTVKCTQDITWSRTRYSCHGTILDPGRHKSHSIKRLSGTNAGTTCILLQPYATCLSRSIVWDNHKVVVQSVTMDQCAIEERCTLCTSRPWLDGFQGSILKDIVDMEWTQGDYHCQKVQSSTKSLVPVMIMAQHLSLW